MKVGIIGLGFVGLSFASVLASKGYFVIGVDSDKTKVAQLRIGKLPFYEPQLGKMFHKALKNDLVLSTKISSVIDECELIFITVGTPQLHNGFIDLSIVKSVIGEIGTLLRKTTNVPIIIIKSTVIPGTTKNIIVPILEKKSKKKCGKGFEVLTNPEFLREGNAINDTIKPHVVILGGNNSKFLKKLKKFYFGLHSKVSIVTTNHQTAEIIKYANNSFLATKISFINQIANICHVIQGADIEDVAKIIGMDPRIGNHFLNAGPGFGGSCLPKDLKAIINFSKKMGVNPVLLESVEKLNEHQIQNILYIIKKTVGVLKGKKITILGLSFKPMTDDVRDSVSIKLIKLLLKKGAKVKVHDPIAIKNTEKIFGTKITYAKSIKTALESSQCGVIMTSWKQYARLNKKDLNLMKKRIIIDTRRLLVGKNLNADYHAIGIG